MRFSKVVLLTLFVVASGLAARAQAVYEAGQCGGSYALVAGDHVRFTPGSNPVPDYLYLYVEGGQGNAIISDGIGDVSSAFYFNAGDLILLGTSGPFDVYFQGDAVQLVYGGAKVGSLSAPVCGTGLQGPVILLPDKKYSVLMQSSAQTSVNVGVYASAQSLYSGSLPYILATNYTQTGSYDVPTCTGSDCCNPQSLVFTVNNTTGSPFEIAQVQSKPSADFDYLFSEPIPLAAVAKADPTSGAPPLTVSFQAKATGGSPPYSYSWDFGDGSAKKTAQNPSHTYDSAGTYNPVLRVTDSAGTVAKDQSLSISVGSPVSVTASATPTSGYIPLTVTFTASASGGTAPYTYAWDFGDGAQSTEQNTSHTYTTAGTYHAVFTATDSTGAYATESLTIQANSAESVPVVLQVKKLSSPFRLKILGSGFVPGCEVLIDGAPVPLVSYKSATKVVAKKGRALKDMVPKGSTVCVTVSNPQGSESPCFSFTR